MRLFGKFRRRLQSAAWTFLLILVSLNVVLRITVSRAKYALLKETIASGRYSVSESNEDLPKKDDLMYWIPYFSIDSLHGKPMQSLSSSISEVRKWIKIWPLCSNYFAASLMRRMVQPYYFGQCDMNNVKRNTMSVTLAIQMDMSHTYWEKLKLTSQHWTGPISLGLHIQRDEDNQLEQITVREMLYERFKKYNLLKAWICVHLLIEPTPKNKTYYYPVNSLRNVATKYINTKYVLYIEADFIPMPGLAELIQRQVPQLNTSGKAFVIPAYYSTSGIKQFPTTKTELIQQWNNNVIIPWWYNKNWKRGHLATKYEKIPNATSMYKIKYEEWYEPYYVIEKKTSPYYPEELLFGRKDKLIHTTLMDRLGYTFYVLQDTYIVHTPHASSGHTVLQENQLKCADKAYYSIDRKIKALNTNILNTYIQPQNKDGQVEIHQYQKVESADKNKPGVLLLYKGKVKATKLETDADKQKMDKIKAALKRKMPINWWAVG